MSKTCFRPALLFAITVAALLPRGAYTQQMTEGTRIRLYTSSVRKATGVVSKSTADSLTILSAEGGGRITVPVSSIEKIEVSRGKTALAGAKKGLLWGGGFGALFGALVLAVPDEDCSVDCVNNGQVAAIMVGSGFLYGAAIGALVKAEEWESIPLQPRVTLSRNRIGIAMAIPGLH